MRVAEYIEREAVKRVFKDFGKPLVMAPGLAVRQIDAIPSADVVTVVHGRWEEADDGDGVVCSVCREDFCTIYLETERFNYCPNCGAQMKDGE
jgi:hypothetical protein